MTAPRHDNHHNLETQRVMGVFANSQGRVHLRNVSFIALTANFTRFFRSYDDDCTCRNQNLAALGGPIPKPPSWLRVTGRASLRWEDGGIIRLSGQVDFRRSWQ